jgi:hypothetical protein
VESLIEFHGKRRQHFERVVTHRICHDRLEPEQRHRYDEGLFPAHVQDAHVLLETTTDPAELFLREAAVGSQFKDVPKVAHRRDHTNSAVCHKVPGQRFPRLRQQLNPNTTRATVPEQNLQGGEVFRFELGSSCLPRPVV